MATTGTTILNTIDYDISTERLQALFRGLHDGKPYLISVGLHVSAAGDLSPSQVQSVANLELQRLLRFAADSL